MLFCDNGSEFTSLLKGGLVRSARSVRISKTEEGEAVTIAAPYNYCSRNLFDLVRKRGLEPLSLAALAPKSGASALYRLKIQRLEKVEKHEWQF